MTLGLARLEHDPLTGLVDAAVDERGFIALDGGLEPLVWLSLFSDARALPSDRRKDKRGWWGDAYARAPGDRWGSLLWTLRSEPLTVTTARRAQLYSEQALEWLRVDGLAKAITVTTERRLEFGAIFVQPTITRPDGQRWAGLWDLQGRSPSDAIR